MEVPLFSIRIVGLHDIGPLEKICRDTFYESFISVTTEQDMQEYLDDSFHHAKLEEDLKDAESIFYFIEKEQEIVGYGKINFGKPPYSHPEMLCCMEIQRIYIRKEFHGMGAAPMLMDVFFEEAGKRNLFNIWLSTGAFNNKALRFYEKYGFEQISHHGFPVGHMAFDNVVLMKTIMP